MPRLSADLGQSLAGKDCHHILPLQTISPTQADRQKR
jgi:hypothetical protein